MLGCKAASLSVAHASSCLQINDLMVAPWQISSVFCGCRLLREEKCPFAPALWAFGIDIWILFPACTLLSAGLSAHLLQITCPSVRPPVYTEPWCCGELLGAPRKKKKTMYLGICEEDFGADGEWRLGSSVQTSYLGRTTQLHFGQGCTSGPSLGPPGPAKKVEDALLGEHLQMFLSGNRCSSLRTSTYRKTEMGIQWCLRNTQKPSSRFSFPVCSCSRRSNRAGFAQLSWVQTEGIRPISRHKGQRVAGGPPSCTVLLEGPLGATLLPLRSVSQLSPASLCQLSINHLLLRLILQLCKHTLFICYGPLNWMSAPGFPLFHV